MNIAEVAISVRGLSKRYDVFETQTARLAHAFWPSYRKGLQEVWALRGIEFDVARGESLAIIGRNGGGKSTLLQILTGVLTPTEGEVTVNGRVSALLELGSGFNPAYTGRDNVVLNGLLLGLTREGIHARFDEIAAFADIGEAMDRPVSTYSSGMMMRLAFAVQVLTDPEILVIDEALSVGDFFFQQKCLAHIRSLCERGVTLLFVSHDMRTVRDLCETAVYLKEGRMVFSGDSQTAIHRYLGELDMRSAPAVPNRADAAPSVPAGFDALPQEALWRRPPSGGTGPLLAVELWAADGRPATDFRIGDTMKARVYFRTAHGQAGHVSLVMKNRYGQVVSTVGSYTSGLPEMSSGDSPFAVFQLEIGLMLEAGEYSMMVAFARVVAKNRGDSLDNTGWMGPLRIDWDYERDTAPFLGMFGLPVRGELLAASRKGSR